MQLFMSATSPYARLVACVLREKGLWDRVEPVLVNPWESPAGLTAANPFSRVPTLVTDTGAVLSEAALISLYLEHTYPEPVLLPVERAQTVYRKLGLAQGLMDATVAIISNRKFRDDADSDPILRRRRRQIPAAIEVIAQAVGDPEHPDLGDLAIASAIGYLDLRMSEIGWQQREAGLAQWCEQIGERPSLAQTRPA
ncbi:MAG: glutathione S-transferase N-terminal domain-containing protein [Nitrococcus mobilis]|nr:glutathione S-transferase N-terminal domain-containing protein [Nitrococcus mobilis]